MHRSRSTTQLKRQFAPGYGKKGMRACASQGSPAPYPSLFLQCTSAPASTSASAVSVWPFCDARCSAVQLRSVPSSTLYAVGPEMSVSLAIQASYVGAYPSLDLLCTSAPALTTASAVSECPFCEA
jgi:hypothetical protein